MMGPFDFRELPEGLYIDREAIDEGIKQTMNIIISELVDNVKSQTLLVNEIDREFVKAGVPEFLREQSAYRLGTVLFDITLGPILNRLDDLNPGR